MLLLLYSARVFQSSHSDTITNHVFTTSRGACYPRIIGVPTHNLHTHPDHTSRVYSTTYSLIRIPHLCKCRAEDTLLSRCSCTSLAISELIFSDTIWIYKLSRAWWIIVIGSQGLHWILVNLSAQEGGGRKTFELI